MIANRNTSSRLNHTKNWRPKYRDSRENGDIGGRLGR
jgi:hypothetical protein